MIIVYGTPLCKDCVACKKSFDANNVSYEYRDISASLQYLKEFLKIRDSEAIFNEVKEKNGIGIPLLYEETDENRVKNYTFDWESFLPEGAVSSADLASSCSIINGKKTC
ncbi:MAG: hypothetical protein K6F69_10335 [Treponema sp.]|nr:hypothetical protein [Treponema sp.]